MTAVLAVCVRRFPVCTATETCYRVNECVFEWSHLVHLDHRGYPMSVPRRKQKAEVIDRVECFLLRAGAVWNVVGLLTLFTLSTW